jgi:hypothetical protein
MFLHVICCCSVFDLWSIVKISREWSFGSRVQMLLAPGPSDRSLGLMFQTELNDIHASVMDEYICGPVYAAHVGVTCCVTPRFHCPTEMLNKQSRPAVHIGV